MNTLQAAFDLAGWEPCLQAGRSLDERQEAVQGTFTSYYRMFDEIDAWLRVLGAAGNGQALSGLRGAFASIERSYAESLLAARTPAERDLAIARTEADLVNLVAFEQRTQIEELLAIVDALGEQVPPGATAPLRQAVDTYRSQPGGNGNPGTAESTWEFLTITTIGATPLGSDYYDRWEEDRLLLVTPAPGGDAPRQRRMTPEAEDAREMQALRIEDRIRRRVERGTAPSKRHEAMAAKIAGKGAGGLGEPLPAAARRHLEPFFQRDLSAVRVRADSDAREATDRLGALAMAKGGEIWLGTGAPPPSTPAGTAILGHEVAHILQGEASARARAASPGGLGAALERAANRRRRRIDGCLPRALRDHSSDGPWVTIGHIRAGQGLRDARSRSILWKAACRADDELRCDPEIRGIDAYIDRLVVPVDLSATSEEGAVAAVARQIVSAARLAILGVARRE